MDSPFDRSFLLRCFKHQLASLEAVSAPFAMPLAARSRSQHNLIVFVVVVVVVVFRRSTDSAAAATATAAASNKHVVVVVFRCGYEQSVVNLSLLTQHFAFVQVALIDCRRNQIVALLLFKLSSCQLQKIFGESGVGHQR